MASPRTVCGPNDSATPLSGWPSKRSRKISDHAMVKPELAGLNGDIATPLAASVSTHAPFDPSRGQLAPPSASTVARAPTTRRPSGVWNSKWPSSFQPVQRWRSANCTPMASSRRNHARRSGDALNAAGKTRPLEPMKVGCPNASLHSCNSAGGKLPSQPQAALCVAIARQKSGKASLCVRLSPPRPAIRNLRPADGIAS